MPDIPDGEIHAAAARRALQHFPVDAGDMKFIRAGENLTYRVYARDGERSYVLRLHRPGYNALSALNSERLWTNALLNDGIRAPQAICSLTGENYVSVTIPEAAETRWAGLSLWVKGDLLSSHLDSEQTPLETCTSYLFALGALIGAIHCQASSWTPPRGFSRHRLDADALIGGQPLWGPFWKHQALSAPERALLERTRDTIHKALLKYGEPESTFTLIHGDPHAQNVIVAAEGLTLIDFDDAAFGWHQYDLAVALQPYAGTPRFDAFHDALIKGYRSRRRISDRDLSLVPMFVLARQLAQIGWSHTRPELGTPVWFERVKAQACKAAHTFVPPF